MFISYSEFRSSTMTNWYIQKELENKEKQRVIQLACPVYREESPYTNELPYPIYLTKLYLTLFDDTMRIIGKEYLKNGPTTFAEYQFNKDKIQLVTEPNFSGPYQNKDKPDFLKVNDLPLLADLQTFNPNLEEQIKHLITMFGITK